MNVFQEQLLEAVASSQEGDPVGQIRRMLDTGYAANIEDDVDRLLAGSIKRAMVDGDVQEMVGDLEYAATQIQEAARAVSAKFLDIGSE